MPTEAGMGYRAPGNWPQVVGCPVPEAHTEPQALLLSAPLQPHWQIHPHSFLTAEPSFCQATVKTAARSASSGPSDLETEQLLSYR